MRKFGPLQNSNRIPNHQALALVMLLLGADKNAVHNQKIIEAAKTIWPKIGHKTSSDRIDKLINQMIYINSDLFETKNGNTIIKQQVINANLPELVPYMLAKQSMW